MVLCRTAVEAAFLVFYFHIYSFKLIMPTYYKCNRAPCNNEVMCYVDRPKQKTLVIWVMFGTGCVTVMIGLIEMWSLGLGKIYDAWLNRHDGEWTNPICIDSCLRSQMISNKTDS